MIKKECLIDALWMPVVALGIGYTAAYPFGEFLAPDRPPLARFTAGILFGCLIAYMIFLAKGVRSTAKGDPKKKEADSDLLWVFAINFTIAYPIGRFAVPDWSIGIQFAFGSFISGMFSDALFGVFIAPRLYARRWNKKKQKMQEEREALNAGRA